MSRFLTPKEFVQLLALPVPFVQMELPISDRDPDPGLFGPGSVSWRVLREPMLILAGGRALLLQAAHPHVAQGAIDHSAYREDPFGRLMRTYEWAGAVAFGTTREAEAASQAVNRLHAKIAGRIPPEHGTRRVKRGSHYSAQDENLLLWVHATFVDTLLVAHDTLVGGLTKADRDRFVREWDVVGRMMGVPDRLFWKSAARLRQYVEREVKRGAAQPGDGSRLVAETILHPPLPTRLITPLWGLLAFMTEGFLPAKLHQGYRIFWTPAHTAAFRSITLTLRMTRTTLPRRLRVAPIYDFAMMRARGELPAPRNTKAA